MTKCIKFLENELDRINEYLCMAQSALVVPIEVCNDSESCFLQELNTNEKKIINVLSAKLDVLSLRLEETKKIIKDFKQFYFENI